MITFLDSEWREESFGFIMVFIYFTQGTLIYNSSFYPKVMFRNSIDQKSNLDDTSKRSFFSILKSFHKRKQKLRKSWVKTVEKKKIFIKLIEVN